MKNKAVNSTNVIAVIPCRYASKRLPGKPLLNETGKPLVQHVYENVLGCASIDRVIVATDDERIYKVAKGFGAEVEMTSSDHISGTDRIAEVASRIEGNIFVNVQGDEPEIDPDCIDKAVAVLADDEDCAVSTVCSPISDEAELEDPNTVKCVTDTNGYALYFSRSPVPHGRPGSGLKHHGIYCFRREVLLEFPKLEPAEIEKAEHLEQLRLLWYGYRIKVCLADCVPKGIDTMKDYKAFVARIKTGKK